MKGGIGAYLSALSQVLDAFTHQNAGSLSILLTSDEEGTGTHGTRRVLEWLRERREKIDACLVGEPTNPTSVGEMVKVGRRGSLNGKITVLGEAGHVAYPTNAVNPIPTLLGYLNILQTQKFDQGNDAFDPTHLEITSIDVGNGTTNVIPAHAAAHFNIRFNNEHSGKSLTQWLIREAEGISDRIRVTAAVSGEAFLCSSEGLKQVVLDAVQDVTGRLPVCSTTGGTSDARFIKDLCPVIEFGLVSRTAHQINEHIALSELYTLRDIYAQILKRYFRLSV
jgi:succinyl-diaminopimelate desuccinylase